MRALLIGLAILMAAAVFAQSPQYERGQAVRVRPPTSPTEGQTLLLLRVVAVPGDRIRVNESQVLVHEVVVGGFSSEFLNRVARAPQRIPQVVPEMHYFLMGELRVNGDISEYWGLHPGARLEAAQ